MIDVLLAVAVAAPTALWSWLTWRATRPGWGVVKLDPIVSLERMREIANAAMRAAATLEQLDEAFREFARALAAASPTVRRQ